MSKIVHQEIEKNNFQLKLNKIKKDKLLMYRFHKKFKIFKNIFLKQVKESILKFKEKLRVNRLRPRL